MMDLLASLRSFVAVAATGSFSAVARAGATSQSAVTRRIGDLEAHFGVRLLHRTTRRVSLTPDGEDLLAHAKHLLATAEAMEESLGHHRTSAAGLVRFGAPVGFGNFLAARMPALLARHPALSVELVMSDTQPDMVADRLDIAARFLPLADSSLVVRQIADLSWLVVASPGYLASAGTPQRPEDLARHNCLLHAATAGHAWHFSGPRGLADVHVHGRFSANVLEALYRAALAGLGVARLPELEVAEDLAAGRLVRLLPGYDAPRMPVYLATPSRRHLPPRTRVVLDHVVEITRDLRQRG